MNPNRSTNVETPLSLLNIVQRGGTEDWKELYRRCQDPEVARALATVLPLRDPGLMGSARLWAFLLRDLHPELNLEIDLRPDHTDTGV